MHPIRSIFWGLALVLAFSACKPSLAPPPNIIFLYVDDLGWRDPGYMGNRFHETPIIDQLAQEGMMFTQAYANAPNCAPSRASLMSGLYPPRHGIYTVASPARGKSENRKLIPSPTESRLPHETFTLAEALEAHGYTCGHVGKWHLGDSLTGPLNQGFAVNKGGNKKGSPVSYFSPYQNPNLPDGPPGEYLTDRLTLEAVQFIEANQGNPFFLYLSFYAVHTPFQGIDSLVKKYAQKDSLEMRQNPVYAAMLERVDMNIGKILNTLKDLELESNSLVIFYSDNGNHFQASSAKPLRGSKGMLYEGGIRVPLAIKWPGKVPPHSQSQIPVIGLDFYPSLMTLAGIDIPPNKGLDGADFSDILLGKSDTMASRALYWHFPAYLESYGGMEETWRQTPASAIRKGDWKLIESFEDGKLELYNLKEDWEERHDLSDKYPQKRQKLYKDLQTWQKETQAAIPRKLNPDYRP